MKLVILQDDYPPYHEGGSGVIAEQLAERFSEAGYDVCVITTVRNASAAGETKQNGVRVVRLFADYDVRFRSWVSLYNPFLSKKVKKILQEIKPDIVHVHNVHHYLSYYAIVLAKRFSKKVFITAHDSMTVYFGKPPFAIDAEKKNVQNPNLFQESLWHQVKLHKIRYNPFRTFAARFIVNTFVDRVVVVSKALGNVLTYNKLTHISVVHNGIDVERWAEPKDLEKFKEEKHIGESAILYGGRLSEAKGALKLLKAFKFVQEKAPYAQMLIIGKREGVLVEKMLRQAQALGLENNLVFTGWIDGDKLRSAYYAAALVAVPSLYLDPFPTINLEAFACGKPVVATCFGGSPEIVKDAFNGYVVNPNDEEILARRILNLLNNESLREEYGKNGRELVISEFTVEKQFEEYKNLFESFSS